MVRKKLLGLALGGAAVAASIAGVSVAHADTGPQSITPQATCPVHVPHNNYAWASGRCGNGRWWRLEANCLRADGKHFHLVFGNWSHPVGTSIIRCPKGERFFGGKPDIQVW